MNQNFGKEIWRSKPVHWMSGWKINFLFCICFLLPFLIPFLIYLPIIFQRRRIDLILTLSIFCSIFLTIIIIFILSILQKKVDYIIIYQNGVELRNPRFYSFFRSKFIPFEHITGADHIKTTKSYYTSFLMKISLDQKFLFIFFNNREPYMINTKWVSNFRKCISLISKYQKG